MATLLAVTAKNLSNLFLHVADMQNGVYDAVMLLKPETAEPFALLGLATEQTKKDIQFASDGRKNFVYRQEKFNAFDQIDLTDTTSFQNPRAVVFTPKSGSSFGLLSLDCCAFFNLHYTSANIWKESGFEDVHKFTLSSGALTPRPKFMPEDSAAKEKLLSKSAYLAKKNAL